MAGLNCQQKDRVNSRLSPLLARSPLFVFFSLRPGPAGGPNYETPHLDPQRGLMRQGKGRTPFPVSEGPSIPDHTPGLCPRLPPLLRKAFPPHDLTRNCPLLGPELSTTKFLVDSCPSGKRRVGTLRRVSSESQREPCFGPALSPEAVWLGAGFLNVCRLQNSKQYIFYPKHL